jgi:hypothetical protein
MNFSLINTPQILGNNFNILREEPLSVFIVINDMTENGQREWAKEGLRNNKLFIVQHLYLI